MKYAWIVEHKQEFSVSLMCKIFKVNRSCYYHWIKQGCLQPQVDERLHKLVKDTFVDSRKSYGTRRIKKALLNKYGLVISRRRIGSIMRTQHLKVKTRRRFKTNTTNSNHGLPVAKNRLNRNFEVAMANNVYVGDITYIDTQEGWLYLATVIDLFSRKVVGWAMADHMRTSLVNDAMEMAIKRRNPARGLIWHTDRGSQYASQEHQDLLKKHGVVHSMSRKGNCWDNAVAESFFHSLKVELVYHEKFETRAKANEMIFEYIEIFYNRKRLHSSNNYMSPVQFEEVVLQAETVA